MMISKEFRERAWGTLQKSSGNLKLTLKISKPYVGQSMSYDWIISKIGAGASFGVRAIIKVDNFKLSNYSD